MEIQLCDQCLIILITNKFLINLMINVCIWKQDVKTDVAIVLNYSKIGSKQTEDILK